MCKKSNCHPGVWRKALGIMLSVTILLSTASSLTGCAEASTKDLKATYEEPLSMEQEADLTYEVPISSPHILVDQLGYLPNSNKQVFFFGEVLPSRFAVFDAETKTQVYTGVPEVRGYNDEYGCYVASGDFTEVTKEGHYYIKADMLGTSYEFDIQDGIYEQLFKEALKSYYYNRCGVTLTEDMAGVNAHNACHTMSAFLRSDITVTMDMTAGWHEDETGSKSVVDSVYPLSVLMLAYEIYPGSFDDALNIPESGNSIPDILDEIKYEIDWLLKMQDENTGAVYSALTINDSNNKSIAYVEEPGIDSTYAFAYVLSKFSYIYQQFDKEYATKCLRASDRAWKYAELNETEESDYKFAAATEIYRASGSKKCKAFLDQYLSDPENLSFKDGIGYFGQITYLNTTQEVDLDICSQLMKSIMKRAEEISAESKTGAFLVPADASQSNNSSLLNYMTIMILVDYVITNHEYDTIIENYLHFFLGRNLKAISYLDGAGTNNYININDSLGIMKRFDDDASLVFLLSEINRG